MEQICKFQGNLTSNITNFVYVITSQQASQYLGTKKISLILDVSKYTQKPLVFEYLEILIIVVNTYISNLIAFFDFLLEFHTLFQIFYPWLQLKLPSFNRISTKLCLI